MTLPETDRDDFIRDAPLSDERIAAFYADYLKGRQGCAAVEALFERAGALQRQPEEWDADHVFGSNVIIRKGPFVDKSSYAPYQAWQFALAAERFLMARLLELLQNSETKVGSGEAGRDWDSVFGAVDEMRGLLHNPNSTAIVLTGDILGGDWLVDLTHHQDVTPEWNLPEDLNRTWILGAHREDLIIHIQESDVMRVYAVDISRFAQMREFGRARLEVDPITEEIAIGISKRRGEDAPSSQWLNEFPLRVVMRLFESWRFDTLDVNAAAYANIEPPEAS